MKQPQLFYSLLLFIVLAVPWIYLAIVYDDLPSTIATHFGINEMPDAFGPRNNIFIGPLTLSAVGAGIYFLLKNLYRIDPKRKYTPATSGILSNIAMLINLLFAAIMLFIINWTLHGKIQSFSILFCVMGLFIAYIGNLMHSIKPNYFAGYRLPWTLENEDNWRRTHQLASKVLFIGGIAIAILSLLVSSGPAIFIFITAMSLMTIIPAVYSYKIYKQSLKKQL